MKGLYVRLMVMALAMLWCGHIVAATTLVNDNFDAYSDGANYIIVNSSGWASWNNDDPVVLATNNVSAPNALTGSAAGTHFSMKKLLQGGEVLNSENGGGDLTFSVWVRCRNASLSPLLIQIGQDGAQDRLYFVTGGNGSFTYKYIGKNGIWHDILDFGGQPLEVANGVNEAFQRVELKLSWNWLANSFGSTYTAQVFDLSDTPLCPVTTCEIIDSDGQDNGIIEAVNWFGISAAAQNHLLWLDDMQITVEESIVDYSPQNVSAKGSVTINFEGAAGYVYDVLTGDTPPGNTVAKRAVAGSNDGVWTDAGDASRAAPGDVDKRFYRTTISNPQ